MKTRYLLVPLGGLALSALVGLLLYLFAPRHSGHLVPWAPSIPSTPVPVHEVMFVQGTGVMDRVFQLVIKAQPGVDDEIVITGIANYPSDLAMLTARATARSTAIPKTWVPSVTVYKVSEEGRTVTPVVSAGWSAAAGDIGVVDEPGQGLRGSSPFTHSGERLNWQGRGVCAPACLCLDCSITKDDTLLAVVSSDGKSVKRPGMIGMGSGLVVKGECYVQVVRATDGKAVGPAFHLQGATDFGHALNIEWLVDKRWIICHGAGYSTFWVIGHDWKSESGKMDVEANLEVFPGKNETNDSSAK